jgi:hypothetical protein
MDEPAKRPRIAWSALIERARVLTLAEQRVVGVAPTLRRVHYLLVSDKTARALGYENRHYCYSALSHHTTRGREAGTFPDLSDNTRRIDVPLVFDSEEKGRAWLADRFVLDRRGLLDKRTLLVTEKDGLIPLLDSRFDWMDMTAVKGFVSHTHLQKVARYQRVIYVGDYDPSGLYISHLIKERCPRTEVVRVGLDHAQVRKHKLVEEPAKTRDSRFEWMRETYGHAMQVEADALNPLVLLGIVAKGITEHTGVELHDDGSPVAPDLDAEEDAIRERLRG